MLRLRQSTFVKGGWGLTYVNKTREAQVLLAGSSIMKDLPRKGEYKWAIKHTIFHFSSETKTASSHLHMQPHLVIEAIIINEHTRNKINVRGRIFFIWMV